MSLKKLLDLAEAYVPKKSWPTYDGKELDRSQYLTASEAAKCLRSAYYGKTSPKEFSTNGFAERGHAIEAWVVERLQPLKERGYTILHMGDDQRSYYDDTLGISGTPDGIILFPNDGDGIAEDGRTWARRSGILVEIKSIDPRTNKSALPRRDHVMQVAQNWLLVSKLREDFDLVGAYILYIDASNLFDQLEFEIDITDELLAEVHDRAATFLAATAAEDLPPEGAVTGACDYCAFTARCSAAVTKASALAKAQNGQLPSFFGESDLTSDEAAVVTRFLGLRTVAKHDGDVLEAAKQDVKTILSRLGGPLQIGGVKIYLATVPGVKNYDAAKVAAFAAAHGASTESLMRIGSPFTKLTVSE